MEKPDIIDKFLTEYSLELSGQTISVEDLLALGISREELILESDMRQKYGDQMHEVSYDSEEVNEAKKSVEKISDKDINLSKSLAKEFEKIDKDSFNSELETLLMRVGR